METYIFTFKNSNFNWKKNGLTLNIYDLKLNKFFEKPWNVLHKDQINIGDRVFIVMQGLKKNKKTNNAIVGSGYVVKNKKNKTTVFLRKKQASVLLKLDVILDVDIDKCLHQNDTRGVLKKAKFWSYAGAGMHLVDKRVVRELESQWSHFLWRS